MSPEVPGGGMGAEQFDRRIISKYSYQLLEVPNHIDNPVLKDCGLDLVHMSNPILS